MDIGILDVFRNAPKWHRPFPQYYAERLAQARLAEELGYDHMWLSEHHFSEDGYSPSLLTIAAAMAAITSRIRIGTNLILLPLHNAVRVAEDAATVDIISNGRLDLGFGRGYSKSEFEGYGIPLSEAGSRLREGLAVVKGLWTNEEFSYEGKHYHLKNARLMPRPVQKPHAPIWVGSHGPQTIDLIAREGFHFLGTGEPTAQQAYDAALQKHNRPVDKQGALHLVWCHVADTWEQAWDNVQDHLYYMFSEYMKWFAVLDVSNYQPGLEPPPMPTLANMRHTMGDQIGYLAIGSAESVIERLDKLTSSVRTTHLSIGMNMPGMHPDMTRRSMELFAKKVMPHLRKK